MLANITTFDFHQLIKKFTCYKSNSHKTDIDLATAEKVEGEWFFYEDIVKLGFDDEFNQMIYNALTALGYESTCTSRDTIILNGSKSRYVKHDLSTKEMCELMNSVIGSRNWSSSS